MIKDEDWKCAGCGNPTPDLCRSSCKCITGCSYRIRNGNIETAAQIGAHDATLRDALAFAVSVIKSGEPWSEQCETIIGGALRRAA